MKKWTISTVLAAATLLMTAVFGGNTLAAAMEASAPAPTEEVTAPTEADVTTQPPATQDRTEPSTLPPATEPAPTEAPDDALRQALEQIAAEMPQQQILVYDTVGAEMLFCSGEGSEQLYPASITKLFAVWVALQHLEAETVVTAGSELSLVRQGSSIAYIGKNCRLTVEMLVEAMLLPSGNDAAYVLAAAAGRAIKKDETLDGVQAVQAFVKEMNREAERQGLENTHFANPDGYHAGAHYSSLRDVAKIGSLLLELPVARKYMTCVSDKVVFESGEHITWYNSNRLVNPESEYYIPGVLGMKTGYTEAAGYCLLSAFDLGERQLVIGIFGAEDPDSRYEQALRLLSACTQPNSR